MTWRSSRALVAVPGAVLLACAGCTRDLGMLDPATHPPEAAVFIDGFGPGVQYSAFGGSKTDALDIELDDVFRGTAALKFTVPGPGDPSGGYAGGAFYAVAPRDLTGFDALTFWARASTSAVVNTVGIGNDASGTSMFTAELAGLPVSTTWAKYAVPLPLASKLGAEKGLFFMAEGSEFPVGYDLWFDDVQFERTGTIASPRPSIASQTVNGEVGTSLSVAGTQVVFDASGTDRTVIASPSYFTFASSNPSVAAVDALGGVQLVGPGSAMITAQLGATPASGAVTVNVSTPPDGPPPTPTLPEADVISLFSDAYQDVPVDTWSAVWDQADVQDVQIGGANVKKYTNLAFAGIEFTSSPVNASAMTDFHVDLWTSDPSAFRIKLVDFGANGAFGGGDDTEHELTLNTGTTPPIAAGTWNSLDIPMAAFAGLAARSNLAQLIISGASPTVYLANVYFFKTTPNAPTEPAPTPTHGADHVISLFSDAYDDRTVDTWSAVWDQADVEDVQIQGDAVKKYTNLVFAGIEFTSQPVDATAATHFHIDVWTPDPTSPPVSLRFKLVDFGADGAFGGGDDVEHEVAVNAGSDPPLATAAWVSYDIPLTEFANLTTRGALAQLILVGEPNTVYVDNVYLHH